jgi:exopolysaccharide production protein ExoZ
VNHDRADRFSGPANHLLPSVQWLRAIAAMMVVIHHINFHTDWLREQAGCAPSALSNMPWSFGIHIFFVISGFIMILTTRNFGEPGAWKRFLVRRILRIVPLYWILTTVMVVGVLLAPHSIEISGDRFWYIVNSYFFIPVLRSPGDLRPILGQGWTLDYEMYFYLALALATLWTRRLGVGILTAVFIALAWLGRDLDVSTPKLFTWTDGIILEFVLGLYLGLLYGTGWRVRGWVAACMVVAGTALAMQDFQWTATLSAGIPATMIVGGFVLCPPLKDSIATGWLTGLGNASYSLYLSHTLALRPLRDVWMRLTDGEWPPFLFFVLGVIVSVFVGCAIHYAVERPVTRVLNARLRRSSAKVALPVAATVN